MLTQDSNPSSTTRARRRSSSGRVLVIATLAAGIFACTRSPGSSTTTVTSGTYDIDTGACMCRLPQDEYLSCCRAGMELTCRCNPNSSCFVVPTGRTCGRTPPTRLD